MGLGGISLWQLLIILLIVVLVFGTKKLRSMGGDLGGALKSFRKAMEDRDDDHSSKDEEEPPKLGPSSSEPSQRSSSEQKADSPR